MVVSTTVAQNPLYALWLAQEQIVLYLEVFAFTHHISLQVLRPIRKNETDEV
jgi:hypothetical protein